MLRFRRKPVEAAEVVDVEDAGAEDVAEQPPANWPPNSALNPQPKVPVEEAEAVVDEDSADPAEARWSIRAVTSSPSPHPAKPIRAPLPWKKTRASNFQTTTAPSAAAL
jgi:hypothetical protein